MSAALALVASGKAVAVPFRVVRGAHAVAVEIQTRLVTQRGNHPDDVGYGLPWSTWEENPATPNIEIEGTIRSQLREVEGWISTESVTITRSGSSLSIGIVCRVRDDDGTVVTVGIGDESDGPAYYTIRGPGII